MRARLPSIWSLGLQYNKDNQPDNVRRLTTKFRKDIAYVRSNFKDYEHVFMLWSPIVRNQKAGAKHNQLARVAEIAKFSILKFKPKLS